MRFLRSFLGGLLGSVAGIGLHYAITQNLNTSSPWVLLVIGLMAGLGVRLFCGEKRSASTGLVATVTALIVLLGFTLFQAANAELSSEPLSQSRLNAETNDEEEADTNQPPASSDSESGDPESNEDTARDEDAPRDGEDTAAADDTDPTTDSEKSSMNVGTLPSKRSDTLVKTSFLDVMALAMTGLLAYLVGRGSKTAADSTQRTRPQTA